MSSHNARETRTIYLFNVLEMVHPNHSPGASYPSPQHRYARPEIDPIYYSDLLSPFPELILLPEFDQRPRDETGRRPPQSMMSTASLTNLFWGLWPFSRDSSVPGTEKDPQIYQKLSDLESSRSDSGSSDRSTFQELESPGKSSPKIDVRVVRTQLLDFQMA